jgi:predicted nucleic acid-binding Zn ribbon protein
MKPTPEQIEQWELEQIKQGHSHLFARPIRSVVRKLMAQKDYGAIESTQALFELWPKIVGEKLVATTRVRKISRGTLLIEASSSQALQELHFQKTALLKKLNAELPAQKILRLRFVSGTF